MSPERQSLVWLRCRTVKHGGVEGGGAGVGIWADLTHQEGPYPSQARSETLTSMGLVSSQQSQYMARSRESSVMFISSQYVCMT